MPVALPAQSVPKLCQTEWLTFPLCLIKFVFYFVDKKFDTGAFKFFDYYPGKKYGLCHKPMHTYVHMNITKRSQNSNYPYIWEGLFRFDIF